MTNALRRSLAQTAPSPGGYAPPRTTRARPVLPDTLRRTRLLLHAETKFATRDTSIHRVIANAGEVILGKERQIRLAVACILARGHLLIEDLPGVGKTRSPTPWQSSWAWPFSASRLPATSCPRHHRRVRVRPRQRRVQIPSGPIFSQLILADEVNRATPKTQSALLEAMEEHQVTAEGETRPLPQPFS